MHKVVSTENPSELIANKKDVLVKFSAEWCQPCKALEPVMEELASEGYDVIDVDIDVHADFSNSVGIRAVPTVIRFVEGSPVGSPFVGKRSKAEYLELMSK